MFSSKFLTLCLSCLIGLSVLALEETLSEALLSEYQLALPKPRTKAEELIFQKAKELIETKDLENNSQIVNQLTTVLRHMQWRKAYIDNGVDRNKIDRVIIPLSKVFSYLDLIPDIEEGPKNENSCLDLSFLLSSPQIDLPLMNDRLFKNMNEKKDLSIHAEGGYHKQGIPFVPELASQMIFASKANNQPFDGDTISQMFDHFLKSLFIQLNAARDGFSLPVEVILSFKNQGKVHYRNLGQMVQQVLDKHMQDKQENNRTFVQILKEGLEELKKTFEDDQEFQARVKLSEEITYYSPLGMTLDHFLYLQEKPLEEKQVLHLIQELKNAIHYLSNLGIAHGDLKLENILVVIDDKGLPRLKLIDFDVSRPFDSQQNAQGMNWEHLRAFGAFAYKSPERLDWDYQQKTKKLPEDLFQKDQEWGLNALIYSVLSYAVPEKDRPPHMENHSLARYVIDSAPYPDKQPQVFLKTMGKFYKMETTTYEQEYSKIIKHFPHPPFPPGSTLQKELEDALSKMPFSKEKK